MICQAGTSTRWPSQDMVWAFRLCSPYTSDHRTQAAFHQERWSVMNKCHECLPWSLSWCTSHKEPTALSEQLWGGVVYSWFNNEEARDQRGHRAGTWRSCGSKPGFWLWSRHVWCLIHLPQSNLGSCELGVAVIQWLATLAVFPQETLGSI